MFNILITGSNSFLASELIKILDKSKYKVIGFDIDEISLNKIEYYCADLRDSNLNEIISQKIDILIHLGAVSNTPDCEEDIKKCYDINLLGTLNLLKNFENNEIKKIIFASSEWVYEKKNNVIQNEKSIINFKQLKSHYSVTKLIDEFLLNDFCKRKKIDLNILRFGILYGLRKSRWSAFESLVHQVYKTNRNDIKVGSLSTGRNYLYVKDAALAIIKSFEIKNINILNIQGPKFFTLSQIINYASNIVSKKINIQETNPNNPSIKKFSNKLSTKLFNWSPKFMPENGIEILIEYFNKNNL